MNVCLGAQLVHSIFLHHILCHTWQLSRLESIPILSEQAANMSIHVNFQTSYNNRKDRMTFLLPKLWAVWKFWPEGVILSFSLWVQDSMAPSLPYCSPLWREQCSSQIYTLYVTKKWNTMVYDIVHIHRDIWSDKRKRQTNLIAVIGHLTT